MAITQFKVIHGHRFWYQSITRNNNTSLHHILHHNFQLNADY